jgi:hypothetical protein
MIIHYKANNRKPLVQAVSEFTGTKAVYLKTPTYAYQIGDYTVTREGNLATGENTDSQEMGQLLSFLESKGFTAEDTPTTADENEAKEQVEETESTPRGENLGLTVAMPLDQVSLTNLEKLLKAKCSLIKKALGISELPIETGEDQVSFPWFSDGLDADAVRAYTNFIAALCKMSREQTRVSDTEKTVENEKYAFRCFLLRLGFVGEEYKTDRKILLKNLSGSSSFKSGAKKEATNHGISE